jgi:uncharacterized protein (TIRG00374 family)
LKPDFDSPGKKTNNFLRWLPGLLISAIALFALSRFVNVGNSLQILRSTNFAYFLLMLLFTAGFLFVRSIGWKALLGKKAKYWQVFLKVNEGYFINNIFPFKLGEISRAVFMGATMQVNPGKILSTIVMERVIDLFILAVFLLSLLPFAVGMEWVKSIAWVILGLVVIGLVILFFVVKNSRIVNSFLVKIGSRSAFIKKYILPFVFSVLDGFQSLQSTSQLIAGFLGILGSWLVSFVQYSVLLYLLVDSPKIWWGAFTNTILALGVAMPSAPAGLGIFESSIVAALNLFNIQRDTALAYALLMHVAQFLITSVIGFFALMKDGYSLRGLFTSLLRQKEIQSKNEFSGEHNE